MSKEKDKRKSAKLSPWSNAHADSQRRRVVNGKIRVLSNSRPIVNYLVFSILYFAFALGHGVLIIITNTSTKTEKIGKYVLQPGG